jgi:diaminopimelate decarboxylase
VTDGGMHCFMAAAGMGSLLKRYFPMTLISSDLSNRTLYQDYHITGPLCTPGDLIGKAIRLPKAEIGDLIMIHKAGAYGPTASPIMFLSQGFPAEILAKNGRAHLIRLRYTEESFFSNQKIHVEDNA